MVPKILSLTARYVVILAARASQEVCHVHFAKPMHILRAKLLRVRSWRAVVYSDNIIWMELL